ncbi:DMT family transporter [Reinekea sp.]|jgi:drug/metabolite transporter (DMT)-like permease|uniref:DMT family transporter n=1 Tax=Reinekea sp. TaxID=1970455 RepID=UPI0039890CB0
MPNRNAHHFPQWLAVTLLISVATMFAGNHVAARLAFDNGAGLIIALLARSGFAFVIMASLVIWQGHSIRIPRGKRRFQLLLGLMITLQSLSLYSSVARIPVPIALLLINSWPIIYTLLNWVLSGVKPTGRFIFIMVTILFGLLLVLDIPSWFNSQEPIEGDWFTGIALGALSAVFLAIAMRLMDYQLSQMTGSVRSGFSMLFVVLVLFVIGIADVVPNGMALPVNGMGWVGLSALALLYGTASSILFISLPKLNMARNSPIVNFEPVAALFLSFWILNQALSPIQLVGGAVVMSGIVLLSFSKRPQ